MPCPLMYTVACIAVRAVGSRAASTVATGFLGHLADEVRKGITWIFTNSTDFWVRLPSPDLSRETAIGAMQRWMLPLTAAVAVGGMIAAGLRMVLTRRATPLLDAGTGLAAIAAVGTLGVLVPDLLLRAGDAWSDWVLQESTGGAFTSRMSEILSLNAAPNVLVVVLGIAVMLLGAVQAALMLFRQAAILVLAAVLPMAAAGATAPLTRSWIRKLVPWMLALITYKPAAAAVYAAAFTMLGEGTDLRTILMGFVMIVLSLVALPVLLRFFTWTTGTVTSGSGGAQLLGAIAGAVAMGAARGSSGESGGTSASEHASYLSARQPPAAAAADGATADSSGAPHPTGAGGASAAAGSASRETGSTTADAGADGQGLAGSSGRAGASGRAAEASAAGTAGADGGASGLADGAASAPGGVHGADGAGVAGAVGGAGGPAGSAGLGAASAAGPVAAAFLAGQALASGARDAAAGATWEGDQR